MAIPSIEQIIRMRCDGTWHVEIDGVIYVPAIRCKDCIHMHHDFDHIWSIEVDECWLHASNETGALGKNRTEPNGFCAWGERKVVD